MNKYLLSIFGSSVDSFYESDMYPQEGDFSHARFLNNVAGGPCFNMCAVAASKGVDVKALDMLGKDDDTTNFLLDMMEHYHINKDNVFVEKDVRNGKVLIILTGDKRTMFVLDPIRPHYIVDDKLQNELNNASYIYSMLHMINRSFGDIEPLLIAKKNGAKVVIDGSSKYDDPSRVKMLYDLADGLFINDVDYERLKEKSDLDPKDIILKDENNFVVVTKGSKGSSLYLKNETIDMPAVSNLKVVDSTGAGDAFAGAFLASLLKDYDYKAALRYATLSGAYACTVFGGQGGVASFEQLDNFAKEYKYDI